MYITVLCKIQWWDNIKTHFLTFTGFLTPQDPSLLAMACGVFHFLGNCTLIPWGYAYATFYFTTPRARSMIVRLCIPYSRLCGHCYRYHNNVTSLHYLRCSNSCKSRRRSSTVGSRPVVRRFAARCQERTDFLATLMEAVLFSVMCWRKDVQSTYSTCAAIPLFLCYLTFLLTSWT